MPPGILSNTDHLPLQPRTTTTNSSSGICVELDSNKLVIDRKTLIVAIAICVIVACASSLALAVLVYREWARRRQTQAAKAWGRKSTFDNRVSVMRKAVDDQYSRQYSGCLVQEPTENPFAGSEVTHEIMTDDRVNEVPAIPAQSGKDRSRGQRMTLSFDRGIGMWLPRRG